MTDLGVFLHSPFSKSNVAEGNNKFLLVQFILSELFQTLSAHQNNDPVKKIYSSVSSTFYPLDWTSHTRPINKIIEHSELLKQAFPNQKQAINLFKHALTNTTTALSNHIETPSENFFMQFNIYIKQLYLLLEPIMLECKSDENFLFFLLKNQENIHSITYSKYLLTFLQRHCEKDIDCLCESICDKFHSRGFACIIPEVKTAILHLKQKNE